MSTINSLVGAAVLLALAGGTAHAQTQACGERDRLTMQLMERYGESFNGGGLRDSMSIFEVWMSEESGTWTLLLTRANGTTCVMATGTNWRDGLPSDKVLGTPS